MYKRQGQVTAEEDLEILGEADLQDLVGPIALYPDDLLAIVLPASTYPLQIVEAARFVEDLKNDKSLEPDEDWDDSVVALTNYPEVLEMMNEDLDWTFRLGEAVVAQQTDVIQAIEAFRDRAHAAGNLKSDEFQVVTDEDGVIEISPAKDDVIYVPYYEPERVVVYQPRPVYYYYPRAYPVYYYPYPLGYSFDYGYFWGVTTAFRIGWHSHHLHTWHHSYWGHPYYGHYYYPRYWYRRPDIHVYNNYYRYDRRQRSYDRYRRGDYWRPANNRRTVRGADRRITRTRQVASTRDTARRATNNTSRRDVNRRDVNRRDVDRRDVNRRDVTRNEIRFRERPERNEPPVTRSSERRNTNTRQRETIARAPTTQRQSTLRPSSRQQQPTVRSQRYRSEPRPQVQRQRSEPRPQVQRQRSEPRPQVQRQRSAPRREPQSRPSRQQSSGSASRPSRERSNRSASSRRESSSRSSRRR